jgi:ATP-dependent Clp protease ATP-binding subunit ClpX
MGRTASVSKKVELVEESPFEEIQRLYSVISKRVVGQEDAKRVVAMAVALHLDRVKNNSESAKSNVLLYGPTGSGKTEIARAIVNDLKCAFLIVDCSKLTPSGFVGEDPSSFLLELFEKSGDDLEKTQQGIVFLDEIDKLCVANYSHEGAFQSRKVMAELLKIIEGQKIQFKRKSFVPGMDNNLTIDTKNILFIAAGAFAGIEEHYASSDSEKVISFSVKAPVKVSSQPAQGEFVKALFKFGMMPELAGRFQLMSSTKKLGKEDYIGLIENKSFSHTTNYYAQLLAKENVTLTLSQELISELADQAIQLGLGVRGIQGLVETRMVDLVFDIEALRGKTA